jgi:ferredoxin-NADP reductase
VNAVRRVAAAEADRIEVLLHAVQPLSPAVKRYEFVLPGGGPLPPAEAGAHIGVFLPNGLERQYSLLEPSAAPDRYVIAVKQEENGNGGSRFMHERLNVGDRLTITAPRNNFPLCEEAEFTVLIAGGIGVTPIWAMAQRLKAIGRRWVMHYASRVRRDLILTETLAGFGDVQIHVDEENSGRPLPVGRIVATAPAGSHLYCCGPEPMLRVFEAAASARPADHVHVEYFSPKFQAATEARYVVELAKTGMEVQVEPGQTILQALRQKGVDVPYSCEEGICGACEVRVLAGEPDHRDSLLSDEERASNSMMMICCSGSKSGRLVIDL